MECTQLAHTVYSLLSLCQPGPKNLYKSHYVLILIHILVLKGQPLFGDRVLNRKYNDSTDRHHPEGRRHCDTAKHRLQQEYLCTNPPINYHYFLNK